MNLCKYINTFPTFLGVFKNKNVTVRQHRHLVMDSVGILAPNREFSKADNLTVSLNLPHTDACCHGNQELGILSAN